MSILTELEKIIPGTGDRLAANVPMSSHSTFHIGGPADIYFEPAQSDEITKIMQFCRDQGVPLTIIGNGSNILVSDRGIRGVVMAIGDQFAGIERHENMLLAKAGTKLASLASFAALNNLAGIEFASGIPGTLGGAVQMNAGAYDRCMADVVILTEYLDENLKIRAVVKDEHQFGYRTSCFSNRQTVILRACLLLVPDERQAIQGRMADLACRRRASQPLDLPSAGSAFKRPPNNYAGKLISECGLKGCQIGNIQVSEKHAGFIVNLGDASATDARKLLTHVQNTVFEKTGIHLEPEIRFIGDWTDWDEINLKREE